MPPPATMTRLLSERRYATIATRNRDGSIHLTPGWFMFEDEKLYMSALESDRKSHNVAARPDATIIVDARESGQEGWVYGSGPAEIIDGDAAQGINSRIARRYLTDSGYHDPRVNPLYKDSSAVTICVTPTTWRSWSLREVDDHHFGGILTSMSDELFEPLDV